MLPPKLVQRLEREYRRDPERFLLKTGISKHRFHRMADDRCGYLSLSELEGVARSLDLDPVSITEPVEPRDRAPFRLVHTRNSDSLEGYISRVTGVEVSASARIHTVHRTMVERGFVPAYLVRYAEAMDRPLSSLSERSKS